MDILLGHNKELIRFGDLDLIFMVTAVVKLKICGARTSVFSENTVTSYYKFFINSEKNFSTLCGNSVEYGINTYNKVTLLTTLLHRGPAQNFSCIF